jgi:hypothetical protein
MTTENLLLALEEHLESMEKYERENAEREEFLLAVAEMKRLVTTFRCFVQGPVVLEKTP